MGSFCTHHYFNHQGLIGAAVCKHLWATTLNTQHPLSAMLLHVCAGPRELSVTYFLVVGYGPEVADVLHPCRNAYFCCTAIQLAHDQLINNRVWLLLGHGI